MTAHAETPTLQALGLPVREQGKTIGRPSTYTPATAELICARLADGETVTEIAKTPGMPSRQTVHKWRMRMPAFDALYHRARAIGMESMSDDTLLIADDDTGDTQADGTPNPTNVNRARLQVHARHFLMGKLNRHVYGDRQTVEHTGTVEHAVTLSDRERMRRLATFLAEDAHAGALIEGTAGEGQTAAPAPTLPASCLPEADTESRPIDEPHARPDEI